MIEKKEGLQEQKAPLKNTDNAFVRVERDGSPAMPAKAKKETGNDQQPSRDKVKRSRH